MLLQSDVELPGLAENDSGTIKTLHVTMNELFYPLGPLNQNYCGCPLKARFGSSSYWLGSKCKGLNR